MRVKRAIFLAAGMGKRLAPITNKIPKPLVTVHGVRIIDTLLDAVLAAKIEEIYLVRGYLSEQFNILLNKYPMIHFIDNPDYLTTNNISSVFYARDLVRNAYIIESDLWLRNTKLITSQQEHSNYLAIPVEKTNDWCFFTKENGYISQLSVGGNNCDQMVGISYWSEEDGHRLADRTSELYKKTEKKQLYWDQVALEEYLPQFRIKTRHCTREDVIEIDTLEELEELVKCSPCQGQF